MPRPPRFTDDDVLDAALACVASSGPAATIADVAGRLGGPVGSIYHRFASREVLLARLWLRSVRRFQAGLLPLAEQPDPHRALLDLALHVPRYCREHPDEARALTLHRQDRLLADGPAEVHDEVASLNDDLAALTRRMVRQRYGRSTRNLVDLVVAATRTAPYGLVRPYLGRPVPDLVDDVTEVAADAILRLGDRPAPA